MLVPLLGDAWTIVQHQPKTSELIFPYNFRSVTAGFQRVRNALGIKDLRYHCQRYFRLTTFCYFKMSSFC